MFLAAALPYVAVGKPAILGDLGGWTHRNALLLVVFVSLTLATAVDAAERSRPGLAGVLLCALALASLLTLYAGHQSKVTQAAYQRALVTALREMGAPRPGAVSMRFDTPAPMELRNYVVGSLYHEAFGRSAWLVLPARAPLVRPVAASRRERAYRVKAVHPDMTPECVSRVRVTTRRDASWRWRSWAQLLGIPGPPAFRLEARLVDSRCDS
jgi:hypothetical protein